MGQHFRKVRRLAVSCSVLFAGAIFFGSCTSRSVITTEAASSPELACKKLEEFFKVDLGRYQERIDDSSQAYQNEQWKIETADKEGSLKRLSLLFESLQKSLYDQGTLDKVIRLNEQISKLKLTNCTWVPRLARVERMLRSNVLTDSTIAGKEKANQDWQDRLQKESNAFRVQLPDEVEPVSMALLNKKLSATGDKASREKLYKGFASARAKKWVELGFGDLLKSRNEEA